MILTLQQLKDSLGIAADDATKDVQLNNAIAQANALVSGYVGYDLTDTETVREYTYVPDPMDFGARRNFVHLPQWPVIELVSVVDENGAPLDSYRLNKETGRVDFRTGVPFREAITFRYRAGYDPVPADLFPIGLNLAANVYNNGGQFGGSNQLKSLTMFDAMSMSFDTATSSDPAALIGAWSYVLNRYSVISHPVLK